MDKETLKRLVVPVFFLLFLIPALYRDAVIFEFGFEPLRRSIWVGRNVVGICLWLTLAWCVIRIADVLLWPMFIERRSGYPVPRLLKDLVRLVIVLTTIAVIVSVVFEKSTPAFWPPAAWWAWSWALPCAA